MKPSPDLSSVGLAGIITAGAGAAGMQRAYFGGHFFIAPQLPVLAQGGLGQSLAQIHNVPKSTKTRRCPHLH